MSDHKELLHKIGGYTEYLVNNSTHQSPVWNKEQQRSGKPNKWNYIDGCMLSAILSLYALNKNSLFLSFSDGYMSAFVKEDGSINTYRQEEYNLDNINSGKALFALYDLTGKQRYRLGIETLYRQLQNSPRTAQGSFWHKKIYPNQVWLDGLYMAMPFYMEYETRFHQMKSYLDIIRQFRTVRQHMRSPLTGLYFHGYDETREMPWADPETGCSPCVWSRSIGWFAMALTDTIEKMDERIYFEYRELCTMLKELVDALLPYQHEGGMFYQVVDQPEAQGNYPETSGTSMIAYAILKAARMGILPARYRKYGEKAFWGTAERYLRFDGEAIHLGGICLVAGLGGESRRDGSLGYYLSEPVVENEAKGVAPFVMAYTEILRDKGNLSLAL